MRLLSQLNRVHTPWMLSKTIITAIGLVSALSVFDSSAALARNLNYHIQGSFGELTDFSGPAPDPFFDALENGSFSAMFGYRSDAPDQDFLGAGEPLEGLGFYPFDQFEIELFDPDGAVILSDSLDEGNYFEFLRGVVTREGDFPRWTFYLESTPFPEGLFVSFEFSGDADVVPVELPDTFISGSIDEIGYLLPVIDASVTPKDIPEPMSAIGLVAIGLVSLGWRYRRDRPMSNL